MQVTSSRFIGTMFNEEKKKIQLSTALVPGETGSCSYEDAIIFISLGIPGCFYSSLTVIGWFEQTNYSKNTTN